jgi:hypothetical protein
MGAWSICIACADGNCHVALSALKGRRTGWGLMQFHIFIPYQALIEVLTSSGCMFRSRP